MERQLGIAWFNLLGSLVAAACGAAVGTYVGVLVKKHHDAIHQWIGDHLLPLIFGTLFVSLIALFATTGGGLTALLQNMIGDYKAIIQAFMLGLGITMVGITTIKSKGQVVPILGALIVAALVVFAAFNDKWLSGAFGG